MLSVAEKFEITRVINSARDSWGDLSEAGVSLDSAYRVALSQKHRDISEAVIWQAKMLKRELAPKSKLMPVTSRTRGKAM